MKYFFWRKLISQITVLKPDSINTQNEGREIFAEPPNKNVLFRDRFTVICFIPLPN